VDKISERVDNITGLKEEQTASRPPFPKSVKIEITAACNLQCSFCATSHGLRPKSKMDFQFYKRRLLPMLKEAGVEEVGMFFLGESTTVKELPEYIAEAKRQEFPYIFLTTNGTALDEHKLDAYMKAGLNSLKFSLNYADVEQFVEVAKVKPALFLKMVEGIKLARKVRDRGGYKCGLYASYIDYDDGQSDKMKGLIDELEPYLDEVYSLLLYSQANLVGEENSGRGWTVKGGNPGRAGNPRDPVPCWSLFSEGRVCWDGELAGCCFAHDDRFSMGNLYEMTFKEAWHSQKFQELRSAHVSLDVRGTACEGCVSYG